MLKKEKTKLILYIVLTIILTITAVTIAIKTRDNISIVKTNQNIDHSQRDLLDVINHTH